MRKTQGPFSLAKVDPLNPPRKKKPGPPNLHKSSESKHLCKNGVCDLMMFDFCRCPKVNT